MSSIVDTAILILEEHWTTTDKERKDALGVLYRKDMKPLLKSDQKLVEEFREACQKSSLPIVRAAWMELSDDPEMRVCFFGIMEVLYPLSGKVCMISQTSHKVSDLLLEKMTNDVELLESEGKFGATHGIALKLAQKERYDEAFRYLERVLSHIDKGLIGGEYRKIIEDEVEVVKTCMITGAPIFIIDK